MPEHGTSSGALESRVPLVSRRALRILFPLALVGVLVVITGILFGRDGLQYAINGVSDSSVLIPGAIGLSLLYGIRKFANFGHGELMTLGAYTAFLINVQLGLSLFWGFIAAPVALAVVGILLELLIFSKLEGRGSIPPLVASIGLSLFIQNLVSVLWGTEIKSYRAPNLPNWVGFGGLTLNPIKGLATIILAVGFMVLVHTLLTRTTLGKAMRATADNIDLARTTGIRTRYVIMWTWVLSGALAGVGGILIGIARDVRPTMGFDLLLLIFAAVILGGIGSAYGAMLGSLVIGLATDMSIPYLQWLDTNAGLVKGANYSTAIAFIIMVIVLLVRPEGILGVRRERGGTGAIRWLVARLKRQTRGPSVPKPGGE